MGHRRGPAVVTFARLLRPGSPVDLLLVMLPGLPEHGLQHDRPLASTSVRDPTQHHAAGSAVPRPVRPGDQITGRRARCLPRRACRRPRRPAWSRCRRGCPASRGPRVRARSDAGVVSCRSHLVRLPSMHVGAAPSPYILVPALDAERPISGISPRPRGPAGRAQLLSAAAPWGPRRMGRRRPQARPRSSG